MYVCICVCIYIYMCVCVFVYIYMYIRIRMYLYVCLYIYTCMCVCVSSRNGEHLTDFTLENRLTCLNTKFQKREGKLWTYTYANNTKAQIDDVFINKKWNNSTLNCEAYSSFEGVSTNHRIVTAKIRLSLRKNTTRTTTTEYYE